jgi:hypothetical protein
MSSKPGQRLLNTNSDAYGTSFGPVNAAYWKWNFLYVFVGVFFYQFVQPDIAVCKTFEWSWMALIVGRNVGFLW